MCSLLSFVRPDATVWLARRLRPPSLYLMFQACGASNSGECKFRKWEDSQLTCTHRQRVGIIPEKILSSTLNNVKKRNIAQYSKLATNACPASASSTCHFSFKCLKLGFSSSTDRFKFLCRQDTPKHASGDTASARTRERPACPQHAAIEGRARGRARRFWDATQDGPTCRGHVRACECPLLYVPAG